MLVADLFLYVAGNHPRKHHAQSHKAGANGVVGGLLLSLAEKHHEVGEGGKPEPVAELLDGDTGGYEPHG